MCLEAKRRCIDGGSVNPEAQHSTRLVQIAVNTHCHIALEEIVCPNQRGRIAPGIDYLDFILLTTAISSLGSTILVLFTLQCLDSHRSQSLLRP